MKSFLPFLITLVIIFSFAGCKKSGYGNYPGGDITPYISIHDVRALYKGQDVTLTKQNLFGSTSIAAVVISDHSGNNLPSNLLIVQDNRRLNQLRGIAIDLGDEAKKYIPGDSLIINIEGGQLNRKKGTLLLSGIKTSSITKISNVPVSPVIVSASNIIANPEKYESTLVAIVDGSFLPLPQPGETLAGSKILNDGSSNITLYTNANATFSNQSLYGRGNYYGIPLNFEGGDGTLKTQIYARVKNDIILLSANSEKQPLIITGYMADPYYGPTSTTDANYEYIQLMATSDIDFAVTPYSVVTTNNAGASTPTGLPTKGWATGGLRTFKFNLTSGTAKKGAFFYVGGSAKVINSIGSTSMATSNWIRSFNYSTTNGDGFGNRTTNFMANSGNASGIAVFKGINVDPLSIPVDVIMIGSSGSIYDPLQNPDAGYRITDNDLYKTIDLISLKPQPFFKSGTNTLSYSYNTPGDAGYFNQLSGKYNLTMGRWTQRREQRPILLDKTSPVSMIEDSLSTKLMRIDGLNEVEDK